MTKGERIHSLRREKGMTLEELGEKIGVGKATIKKYENGQIDNIPSDKIEALADALESTPQYIMGWDDHRHPMVVHLEELRAITERPIVSYDPWDPDTMAWAEEDDDIRIMARGMSKMSKENRARLLQVAKVMFEEDFDEEGNKRK